MFIYETLLEALHCGQTMYAAPEYENRWKADMSVIERQYEVRSLRYTKLQYLSEFIILNKEKAYMGLHNYAYRVNVYFFLAGVMFEILRSKFIFHIPIFPQHLKL